MYRQLFIIITITALYTSVIFSNSTDYELHLKIPQYAGEQVKLGNYYGSTLLLHANLTLDKQGNLPQYSLPHPGIFMLIFPDSSSYEIMVTDTGKYSIWKSESQFILDANAVAEDYKLFTTAVKSISQKKDSLQKLAQQTNEPLLFRQKIQRLQYSMDSLTQKLASRNSGNLLGDYCQALQNVDIPKKFTEGDSASWMKSISYYREHYFDNINWNNSNLVYTPVIEERIGTYINQVVSQNAESIMEAVDHLIAYGKSPELKNFIIKTLLRHFQQNRHKPLSEFALVYLAENYILNEPGAQFSDDYILQLRKLVGELKSNLLGAKAPEIKLGDANSNVVNWSNIPQKTTVLLFWDYSCPICSSILSQFNAIMEKYPKVSVITIFPGEDKEIWIAWVKKRLKPEYINTYAESGEAAVENYNIGALPALFVLDKHRNIINKNITVQELDEFLNGISE